MSELIRLLGCLVIAVGWVVLPLSFPHWAESEHDNITKLVAYLIACEIAFLTWVLYCKF